MAVLGMLENTIFSCFLVIFPKTHMHGKCCGVNGEYQ